MQINWFFLIFIAIFIVGCSPEPKEFTYMFTLDSPDTYELTLTIDQTKRYTVQEQYLFFEHKSKNLKAPKLYEGTMNDDDFAEFKRLLRQSKLLKMNNSYGFDKEEAQISNKVIYHINYHEDAKEKFISIQLNDSLYFPLPFTQLIEYTNTLISKYRET